MLLLLPAQGPHFEAQLHTLSLILLPTLGGTGSDHPDLEVRRLRIKGEGPCSGEKDPASGSKSVPLPPHEGGLLREGPQRRQRQASWKE